jgi:hypothetical protein
MRSAEFSAHVFSAEFLEWSTLRGDFSAEFSADFSADISAEFSADFSAEFSAFVPGIDL